MTKSTQGSDPFAWRNGGGRIQVGNGEEGAIKCMMEINGQLFCITEKSIHSIMLADTIDPKRTNPTIPNSQQKVFPYGTNDPFVGRTLLQAKELFVDFALPATINTTKAVSIAFSFLKEVASVRETVNKYMAEEQAKDAAFKGEIGEEDSLQIPSIDNLDQQVKQIVNSIDHAILLIINTLQLFYPDIKISKLVDKLIEELEKQKDTTDDVKFIREINDWLRLVRNLRNSIEHPKENNRMDIKNYRLEETGSIQRPTIAFINNETPFPEIAVRAFATSILDNLISCYEILIVYLCSIHAQPFAGDTRSVIEIPEDKRSDGEKNIRFGYHIAWTK